MSDPLEYSEEMIRNMGLCSCDVGTRCDKCLMYLLGIDMRRKIHRMKIRKASAKLPSEDKKP